MAAVLNGEGIGLHSGQHPTEVRHDGHPFQVTVAETILDAEPLLVATGRRPNLRGLGLAKIGTDEQLRSLHPDPQMQIADGVYSVGGITGKSAFTHLAAKTRISRSWVKRTRG